MARIRSHHPQPAWDRLRTPETRDIENRLRAAGFAQADAYRYNSASIRVRVVDPQFESMTNADREDLVFPVLDTLPRRTREDILLLLTLAPTELRAANRHLLVNQEFEDPLPSRL